MTPQCKEQTSVETKSRDRVEFDQSDRAAPITKIDIAPVAASELSARDVAAWSRIQRQSRTMNGPLFGPEFTKLVAAFEKLFLGKPGDTVDDGTSTVSESENP